MVRGRCRAATCRPPGLAAPGLQINRITRDRLTWLGRDVRVVGPAGARQQHRADPGLQRPAGVADGLTGSQQMWMGYAVLEPGGGTGVHHHAESETAICIVSGVTRWWVGDRLDDVREARTGDVVPIPPDVVHREQNASRTEPVEVVAVRSTQEAIVVGVFGHPHAPEHAR